MIGKKRARVLIVDDSAIARDILARGLSANPQIEIIGTASDAYSARDKIVLLAPDVITLDVEMPRMDGIEFLKRLLPQYPVPVVVVSAVTAEGSRRAFEALDAGAVSVVAKPEASDRNGLATMIGELGQTIVDAAGVDVRKIARRVPTHPATRPGPKEKRKHEQRPTMAAPRRIIALGASTGGTSVLTNVIPKFPSGSPPVVVVQHMPPVFTRMFAESLDRISAIEVKEAKDGDILEDGHAYIAPGDFHATVERSGIALVIRCRRGEKVSGHRPSVDVLFKSVAATVGSMAIGCLMTGMGRDGADGLLEMRKAGARCFAQDEDSSVVFGMPKEAWENGAAESLVPEDKIAETILSLLRTRVEARSTS